MKRNFIKTIELLLSMILLFSQISAVFADDTAETNMQIVNTEAYKKLLALDLADEIDVKKMTESITKKDFAKMLVRFLNLDVTEVDYMEEKVFSDVNPYLDGYAEISL